MIEAYPLCWPEGWPRTNHRESARFKAQFGRARGALLNEVRLLGGTNPILSSNLPTRNDGLPYASFREPSDPGIAIYFKRKGQQVCIACDKYNKVTDNLQALQLTINAMRGIDRWGSSSLLDRAFKGFIALPGVDWRSVFGVDEGISPDMLQEKYRALAKKNHPDITGDNGETMAKINAAYEAAKQELNI